MISRTTARRVAHAWVSALIDRALQNADSDTLGTSNAADYWLVRAEIEAISTQHVYSSGGHPITHTGGDAVDETGLRNLHQAMERLRRARVGRAPSYRQVASRAGISYGAVYQAFNRNRPSWETLSVLVRALGADPTHFRDLWSRAGPQDAAAEPQRRQV